MVCVKKKKKKKMIVVLRRRAIGRNRNAEDGVSVRKDTRSVFARAPVLVDGGQTILL